MQRSTVLYCVPVHRPTFTASFKFTVQDGILVPVVYPKMILAEHLLFGQ